jgi:hypothetical protein
VGHRAVLYDEGVRQGDGPWSSPGLRLRTEEALQDYEHASENVDFIGKPYPLRQVAEKLGPMIRQGTH